MSEEEKIAKVIEAEIHRGNKLILHSFYDFPDLKMQTVVDRLEDYIKQEQLNQTGECMIRVREVPKEVTR